MHGVTDLKLIWNWFETDLKLIWNWFETDLKTIVFQLSKNYQRVKEHHFDKKNEIFRIDIWRINL